MQYINNFDNPSQKEILLNNLRNEALSYHATSSCFSEPFYCLTATDVLFHCNSKDRISAV